MESFQRKNLKSSDTQSRLWIILSREPEPCSGTFLHAHKSFRADSRVCSQVQECWAKRGVEHLESFAGEAESNKANKNAVTVIIFVIIIAFARKPSREETIGAMHHEQGQRNPQGIPLMNMSLLNTPKRKVVLSPGPSLTSSDEMSEDSGSGTHWSVRASPI